MRVAKKVRQSDAKATGSPPNEVPYEHRLHKREVRIKDLQHRPNPWDHAASRADVHTLDAYPLRHPRRVQDERLREETLLEACLSAL